MTIILLGGGADSIGIIERAKEMGHRTMVVDHDPTAPGFKLADVVSLASCYDPVGTLVSLELHKEEAGPYEAVLCAGVDAPHVMASVAREYNLVGPGGNTARLSRDKLAQRIALHQAHVLVPKFTLLYDVPGKYEPMGLSLPVVFKPAVNHGARGVIRVTDWDQLEGAYHTAYVNSLDGRVIAEEWVDGVQLSVEGLVQGGRVIWTAAVERNYARLEEFAPYVIEDGGDAPVDLIGSYKNDWKLGVYRSLQQAAEVLGLETGTIKGDLVWDGERMWVIEVAVRLSGGRMCSHIIPGVWGVDFVGYAIRLALGETIDPDEIRLTQPKHACQRFLFPVFPTCHPERGKSVIGYGWSRSAAREEAERLLGEL